MKTKVYQKEYSNWDVTGNGDFREVVIRWSHTSSGISAEVHDTGTREEYNPENCDWDELIRESVPENLI